MTEMAPERPVPEGAAEIEIDYVFTSNVLSLSTSLGGVDVKMALDYDDDNVGRQADLLIAALPRIVESVLDDLNPPEESKDV